MPATPYKLVVFDLDGTLVDSAPDIAFAVDAAMADLGREPVGLERVRQYLGNGVEWLTRRALTGELWGEPEPALYQQALDRLLVHYGNNNGGRTRVYPGVSAALALAREHGRSVACLTNKKRCFTEPLFETLGLAEAFDLLVCGDDLPRKKPDPAPLRELMRRAGAAPAETLMVGDSVTDVRTARAAGARVAGVRYGYNHGEDIATAGPDWVVDSLDEIRTILTPETPAASPGKQP